MFYHLNILLIKFSINEHTLSNYFFFFSLSSYVYRVFVFILLSIGIILFFSFLYFLFISVSFSSLMLIHLALLECFDFPQTFSYFHGISNLLYTRLQGGLSLNKIAHTVVFSFCL